MKSFKELVEEQLDELSKQTLGSYIKKASERQQYHSYEHGYHAARGETSGDEDHSTLWNRRAAGISRATDKLTGHPAKQDHIRKAADKASYHSFEQGYSDSRGRRDFERHGEKADRAQRRLERAVDRITK